MNEFIVWDESKQCFTENWVLDNKGQYVGFREHEDDVTSEDLTFHQYIGKKDISYKKLYAESSIIEFDFMDGFEQDGRTRKVSKGKGFVTYLTKWCAFVIESLTDEDRLAPRQFNIDSTLSNIKIIDSIQENKLGLIK